MNILQYIFWKLKEINYNFFRYTFNYKTTRELLRLRKYTKRKTNGNNKTT